MGQTTNNLLAELKEVPANEDLRKIMLDLANCRIRYRNFLESINDRRMYTEIEENFSDIDEELESVFTQWVSIAALYTEYSVKRHFEPQNI